MNLHSMVFSRATRSLEQHPLKNAKLFYLKRDTINEKGEKIRKRLALRMIAYYRRTNVCITYMYAGKYLLEIGLHVTTEFLRTRAFDLFFVG